jgi:hypothetical protein
LTPSVTIHDKAQRRSNFDATTATGVHLQGTIDCKSVMQAQKVSRGGAETRREKAP